MCQISLRAAQLHEVVLKAAAHAVSMRVIALDNDAPSALVDSTLLREGTDIRMQSEIFSLPVATFDHLSLRSSAFNKVFADAPGVRAVTRQFLSRLPVAADGYTVDADRDTRPFMNAWIQALKDRKTLRSPLIAGICLSWMCDPQSGLGNRNASTALAALPLHHIDDFRRVLPFLPSTLQVVSSLLLARSPRTMIVATERATKFRAQVHAAVSLPAQHTNTPPNVGSLLRLALSPN